MFLAIIEVSRSIFFYVNKRQKYSKTIEYYNIVHTIIIYNGTEMQ